MSEQDDRAMWYQEWVTMYCEATGSNNVTHIVLTGAKSHLVVDNRATVEELGAVLARFISGGRVPQFPTQVTNAIVNELHELRTERSMARRAAIAPDYSPASPDCALCRDSALVTVPHWLCICVPNDGPPYLVNFVDPRPGGVGDYGRVVLMDVRCTECQRGKSAKTRHPSLANYLRNFNGRMSASAVVQLLAAHERAKTERARQGAKGRPQDDAWSKLVDRIRRRVQGAQSEDAAA